MDLARSTFRSRKWVSALAREPIVQFFAVGALVFAVEHGTRGARIHPDAARRIVVDDAFVEGVRRNLSRTGKEPTADETRLAVTAAVEDEILFREAKSMALDRDDAIVRRRLIQKAEFLIDDVRPIAEPSPSELESYLAAHADEFRAPVKVTFRQLFFARDRRGESSIADARAELERLAVRSDAATSSDPFLAGDVFRERSERDIDGLLGPGIGRVVASLPLGVWSGPIASPFGFHLIRIDERRDAEVPPLAQVRGRVRQAVIDERRDENRRQSRAALRALYTVEDRSHTLVDRVAHAMNDGTNGFGAGTVP